MWSRSGKVWSSELKKMWSQNFAKHLHVHGSEMRQPFGLFSMTFQDLYAPCHLRIQTLQLGDTLPYLHLPSLRLEVGPLKYS